MDEPAFPQPRVEFVAPQVGMTLRDYFAAKAMTTVSDILFSNDGIEMRELFAAAANRAYLLADAMLEARKRGNGDG